MELLLKRSGESEARAAAAAAELAAAQSARAAATAQCEALRGTVTELETRLSQAQASRVV